MARKFPDETAIRVAELVSRYLRAPTGYATDAETQEPILDFDPPLSDAERATLARLVRLARSRVTGITPAEWEVLEPVLAAIRSHRTRTNAEWSAMTAGQRDNALIDWNRNLTDVLRAMLRD